MTTTEEIKKQLREMSPHIRERRTAVLLQLAVDEIDKLKKKIKDMNNDMSDCA